MIPMRMISRDCRSKTISRTRMRRRISLPTPTQKASRPLVRTLAARWARCRVDQNIHSNSPPTSALFNDEDLEEPEAADEFDLDREDDDEEDDDEEMDDEFDVDDAEDGVTLDDFEMTAQE
jgi:hypothetical protein